MFINTSITGTGGTQAAKHHGRHGSHTKSINSLDKPPATADATGLNSPASQLRASNGPELQDSDAASAVVQIAKTNILNQSATAMLAQANLSPETALKLLQE